MFATSATGLICWEVPSVDYIRPIEKCYKTISTKMKYRIFMYHLTFFWSITLLSTKLCMLLWCTVYRVTSSHTPSQPRPGGRNKFRCLILKILKFIISRGRAGNKIIFWIFFWKNNHSHLCYTLTSVHFDSHFNSSDFSITDSKASATEDTLIHWQIFKMSGQGNDSHVKVLYFSVNLSLRALNHYRTWQRWRKVKKWRWLHQNYQDKRDVD